MNNYRNGHCLEIKSIARSFLKVKSVTIRFRFNANFISAVGQIILLMIKTRLNKHLMFDNISEITVQFLLFLFFRNLNSFSIIF